MRDPHRREVRDRQALQKASALLADSFAEASYAYDEALGRYEAALASRDVDRRATAERALEEAGQALSKARAVMVSAQPPA